MKKMLLLVSTVAILGSCGSSKKQAQTTPASTGTGLTLSFRNMAGDRPIHLNTDTFQTAQGERITLSLLQYYVTNIRLRKTDGSEWVIPQEQSYFLVKESVPSSRDIFLPLPEGEYQTIEFMLGVDSLRNTMPVEARKGVLDPASDGAGMYWGWNSGYIFFKMEGYSPAAKAGRSGDSKYRYHIGLFGGMNTPTVNNIKVISLPLDRLKLGRKKQPVVEVHTDVLKVFTGNTPIQIAEHTTVMVTPFSAKIADNYASMFTVAGIH
jgi:hypothetical protein